MSYSITREIGIDAGHRVTYHGSKCRNLHGHRYTIKATCVGELAKEGEEEGMVLDFGFLKDEMMAVIDEPCDHGTILWIKDPLVETFAPALLNPKPVNNTISNTKLSPQEIMHFYVAEEGYLSLPCPEIETVTGKLYIVPFVPTAENLAEHWFYRLAPQVVKRSLGRATLKDIEIFETPNCSARYPVLNV